jgi:hypothetical protein
VPPFLPLLAPLLQALLVSVLIPGLVLILVLVLPARRIVGRHVHGLGEPPLDAPPQQVHT